MDQFSNEPIGTNEPLPPLKDESTPAWLTRKEYSNASEKKKDFWLGFGLWWILNFLLIICQWGIGLGTAIALRTISENDSTFSSIYGVVTMILSILPWAINIGLMIYFAFTRSQMALGMLAGFGSALALAICLGVILTVACFALLAASGG